jgi:hypothetical protein
MKASPFVLFGSCTSAPGPGSKSTMVENDPPRYVDPSGASATDVPWPEGVSSTRVPR